MSDVRELYQQVIIDHGRNPRNFRTLSGENCLIKEGYNPLCGDKLTLYLLYEQHTVIDAAFQGSGCAISMASASLMTERVKGMAVNEALALFTSFSTMVTTTDEKSDESLGKLNVLAGVRAYPSRIKCATLAWHTLKALLQDDDGIVKTE